MPTTLSTTKMTMTIGAWVRTAAYNDRDALIAGI